MVISRKTSSESLLLVWILNEWDLNLLSWQRLGFPNQRNNLDEGYEMARSGPHSGKAKPFQLLEQEIYKGDEAKKVVKGVEGLECSLWDLFSRPLNGYRYSFS